MCHTGVPVRNALPVWEEVLLPFMHIEHARARAVNNVTSVSQSTLMLCQKYAATEFAVINVTSSDCSTQTNPYFHIQHSIL